MLAWARHYGALRRAGVEGTGSYGYGLARQLQAAAVEVREVNRPNRSLRRLRGKSDPLDADVAARAVLSGEASVVPKDRDGPVGQLRALMVARRGAVKARTQTPTRSTCSLSRVRTPFAAACRAGVTVSSRGAAGGSGSPMAPRQPFGASVDGGFS